MLPATTGLGVAKAVTPKSAAGPTVVETEAELLKVFGSTSPELAPRATTVPAVMVPVIVGRMTIVTTTFVPTPILPNNASAPPEDTVPCEVVAEIKLALAGRVVVSVTPSAVKGPLLVTLIV